MDKDKIIKELEEELERLKTITIVEYAVQLEHEIKEWKDSDQKLLHVISAKNDYIKGLNQEKDELEQQLVCYKQFFEKIKIAYDTPSGTGVLKLMGEAIRKIEVEESETDKYTKPSS